MRTTRQAEQTRHLANSREVFLKLLDLARALDVAKVESFRAERDYEGLEMYILNHIMGK
jgi:xylose isomerase